MGWEDLPSEEVEGIGMMETYTHHEIDDVLKAMEIKADKKWEEGLRDYGKAFWCNNQIEEAINHVKQNFLGR